MPGKSSTDWSTIGIRPAQGEPTAVSSGSALPAQNRVLRAQGESAASGSGSALPTENQSGGNTAPRGGVAAAPAGPAATDTTTVSPTLPPPVVPALPSPSPVVTNTTTQPAVSTNTGMQVDRTSMKRRQRMRGTNRVSGL